MVALPLPLATRGVQRAVSPLLLVRLPQPLALAVLPVPAAAVPVGLELRAAPHASPLVLLAVPARIASSLPARLLFCTAGETRVAGGRRRGAAQQVRRQGVVGRSGGRGGRRGGLRRPGGRLPSAARDDVQNARHHLNVAAGQRADCGRLGCSRHCGRSNGSLRSGQRARRCWRRIASGSGTVLLVRRLLVRQRLRVRNVRKERSREGMGRGLGRWCSIVGMLLLLLLLLERVGRREGVGRQPEAEALGSRRSGCGRGRRPKVWVRRHGWEARCRSGREERRRSAD